MNPATLVDLTFLNELAASAAGAPNRRHACAIDTARRLPL